MSRRRQVAIAILCAGVALLCLKLAHRKQAFQAPLAPGAIASTQDEPEKPNPVLTRRAPASELQTSGPDLLSSDALSAGPRIKPPTQSQTLPVAQTPESASLAPATILENMGRTIRQYASAYGENPVGTNPEITSALQGDNPKHINFLKQDGNRVNGQGELVDSWGTPYFFHQISGHEMEIRSAGPDRVMYTADDLVTR